MKRVRQIDFLAGAPKPWAGLGLTAIAALLVAAVAFSGWQQEQDNRRALARLYFERLPRTLGFELPPADFERSNWHMFQPLLPPGADRGRFIEAMRAEGIGIGVHYPAMHLFTLYRARGHRAGEFPHAEDIGRRTVTLPLFPAMADADVERVCAALARVMRRGAA